MEKQDKRNADCVNITRMARFRPGQRVWWLIAGNPKHRAIATIRDVPVYDERWGTFVYWIGGLCRVPEDQLEEIDP